jgi:hypothetical protein
MRNVNVRSSHRFDLSLPFRIPHSAFIILLAFAVPLRGQTASPYVPLSYWGNPYVEHFIAAGKMVDPSPLTRPLRADDLVRALEAMDSTKLGSGEWGVVRALLHDLRRNENGPWGRVDADLGVAAATHSLRDPLELFRGAPPRGDTVSRGFVSGGLALTLALGPVVAVTHPLLDTRLKYDRDWFGKKDRAIAGRMAESYLSAQWGFGELFFGRMDRNWGPSVVQGLLLSDDPYGLDHLGVTLGTSAIQLQAIVTQLDSRTDSVGQIERRYMVQHRLWLRPPGRWTLALWEGSVLSGADRDLEPWYLNILNLGVLEQLNTGTNVNSFVGLDLERRGGVTTYAQLMLDDIQVDRKALTDQKPTSWGLTVGAKGGVAGAAWTLFYTQVANLTYRNEDNLQVPLYHGLGTGRNFADYDQATARLSVVGPRGLLLSPEVTLLRQGLGDPRLAHPAPPAYPSTASLFQGVVERTVRLALGLNWSAGPLTLTADGGAHLISNEFHVKGVTDTRFVGSVGLSWRLHRAGQIP